MFAKNYKKWYQNKFGFQRLCSMYIKGVKLHFPLTRYGYTYERKMVYLLSVLMRIQNLESRDPKEFWKLVKDVRERKRNNLSDNIDPQTWYDWFKKLSHIDISDNDKTFSTIVKNMKDFAPKFPKTLDEYISIQEIKLAAT